MKDELLKKWLKEELTPEELEAFKKLDEYPSYVKLSNHAKYFKPPDFNQEQHFKELESKITSEQTGSKILYLKYIAAIAAVFLIAFTIFKSLGSGEDIKSFETLTAKTQNINLPDQSMASLNANSKLTFDNKDWSNNRQLLLHGEAYFEVEKGSKFTVNTTYANVEVLGTIFNVKSRDYAFEVTCYEGSVAVEYEKESYTLKVNEKLILGDEAIVLKQNDTDEPDWKKAKSVLKSQTLEKVLHEFQNYYDVEFYTSKVDVNRKYTGSFTHNDIEIALKSITLPLGLTYKIDDKKIFLSKK